MRTSGLILSPSGRLEADTCGHLRQQLATAFASGISAVTVDLSKVTTLDPTGLGVLSGAAKHLEAGGGSLTLVGASSALATTLRINGLGALLDETPKALRVVS